MKKPGNNNWRSGRICFWNTSSIRISLPLASETRTLRCSTTNLSSAAFPQSSSWRSWGSWSEVVTPVPWTSAGRSGRYTGTPWRSMETWSTIGYRKLAKRTVYVRSTRLRPGRTPHTSTSTVWMKRCYWMPWDCSKRRESVSWSRWMAVMVSSSSNFCCSH